MTRLSGAQLLDCANSAVQARCIERADIVQDIALALVELDPVNLEQARAHAARVYEAARKRLSRARAVPIAEVIVLDMQDPAGVVEQREKLAQLVAWQRRFGRMPSRSTMYRICRGLTQNP